ncbi:hypothetical protein SLA2020_449440 [Shorea laevis]
MGHQNGLLESKKIKQIILKERKSERLAQFHTFLSVGIDGCVMEFEEMPSLGKEHVQESEVGFTERLGSSSVGRSNDGEDDGWLDMHAIFES